MLSLSFHHFFGHARFTDQQPPSLAIEETHPEARHDQAKKFQYCLIATTYLMDILPPSCQPRWCGHHRSPPLDEPCQTWLVLPTTVALVDVSIVILVPVIIALPPPFSSIFSADHHITQRATHYLDCHHLSINDEWQLLISCAELPLLTTFSSLGMATGSPNLVWLLFAEMASSKHGWWLVC